jgi:ubiquitin C-terminal hydrolase
MNFEKYKNKGLSGLSNLGNTCYLNSTMQILSHTYELNNFLDKGTYTKHLKPKYDSIMLVEWDKLRNILWEENCVVTPNKFLSTLHKLASIKNIELFTGYAQNDMPEFLIFIIDCFHNAISREVNMTIEGSVKDNKDLIAKHCFETIKNTYEKDYSEIWNIFYGMQVSEIINPETKKVMRIRSEPIFILNLPIPSDNKSPTLIDCFNLYTEGELLTGDNQVENEDTKIKEDALKRIMFWSLPSILVIDVKRFNSFNVKNQIMIDFPLENLNLSEYIIGYNKNSYIYDLYAVCNHSGSVLGGHYTAFIKNANGKWYNFNDTHVSEVNNLNYIISPKAYCFFYRKRQ